MSHTALGVMVASQRAGEVHWGHCHCESDQLSPIWHPFQPPLKAGTINSRSNQFSAFVENCCLHRAKQTTENLSKQFRVWNSSFLTISRKPLCTSFHSCLVQREVERVTTLILDTNWLLVLHCWNRERRLWSQSNEQDYTAIREQRWELERRAEGRESIP